MRKNKGKGLNRFFSPILFSLWLALVWLGHGMYAADFVHDDEFEARIYTDDNGNKLSYRLLKPRTLSGEEKYPLVLFLHGIGERGDDNRGQLKWGAKNLAAEDNREKHPCFVAVPQCPLDDMWANIMEMLAGSITLSERPTFSMGMTLELMEVLIKKFPEIDSNRLYITGFSMGGFGTWDAILRKPDMFAAAVPVCGGGDITKAKRITHIPVWAFHGADDRMVDPRWSRDMVEAIREAGGHPRYTEYPDVGHRSWIKAYSSSQMWEWLFQQKKDRKDSPVRIQYPLMIDGDYSPKIGAHSIVTLHRAIYELESRYLGTSWFKEDSMVKKTAGLTLRLAKSVLIDNVLDHLSMLTQHEMFGHGARYREFGYSRNRFTIHPLFPFGDARGWAYTGQREPGRMITLHERMAMNFGGVESNRILSNILRENWLKRGSIHYRESILYLLSSNDLASYILRTKYEFRGKAGNDILGYLRNINRYEGSLGEEWYALTLDHLAAHTWIDILNPFQYYALFAYFATYLWSGGESFTIPMIKVLGGKYLPSFRLGLTPFGSEYFWENFFVFGEKVFSVYVRYGEPTFHRFWGGGVRAVNLIRNQKCSLDTRVDFWHQPPLFLGGENITKTKRGWGGAFLGTVYWRILKKNSVLSLVAQVGYKTSGYLEGEKLGRGFIVRAGLSFSAW